MSQITIVGLGPGAPDLLTKQALDVLISADELYLRTARHPSVGLLPRRIRVVAFDDLTKGAESPDRADALVANRVLELGARRRGTIYAAPGNPAVDDGATRRILDQASQQGNHVRLIPGISLLDAALRLFNVDLLANGVQVLSAASLVRRSGREIDGSINPFVRYGSGFDATRPLVIGHLDRQVTLDQVRETLQRIYPPQHPVWVVPIGENGGVGVEYTTSLVDLGKAASSGTVVYVYLEPLERLADVTGFDTLRYIVARLRAPNGCPWDREQTHESMKKHFIEETYEAIAALDEGDWDKFAEELGDVFLQVVMHGQLGQEARTFDLEEVLRAVNEKLIRRHPHVFGDVQVGSSADVLRNWEKIKRAETSVSKSSFANIPQSIPALMRADAVQSRAARYGWTPTTRVPDVRSIERLDGRVETLRAALGEALFELVALARRNDVDPEEALRLATNQFANRLERALDCLRSSDPTFEQLPPEERRHLVAKALEREPEV